MTAPDPLREDEATLLACAQAFEDAIGEGYPTPARKVDQCEHGQFGWEDCIACYDIALMKVVEDMRARAAIAALDQVRSTLPA